MLSNYFYNLVVPFWSCIHTAPFSPCGTIVLFLFRKYFMPPKKRVPCQCGLDLSRSNPLWHSDGTTAKKCIRAKEDSEPFPFSKSMFAPKAKKVKKDAK